MTDLVITGSHVRSLPPQAVWEGDYEIWVFNKPGTLLPRYDVVFQLHRPQHRQMHEEWLRQNTTYPVWMLEKYPEYPMSQAYPFKEVLQMLGKVSMFDKPFHYLPFSVAMALALAIYQKRSKIILYGIELDRKTEYVHQRNSFSFWIGFAAGRGIEIDIQCGQDIFLNKVYQYNIFSFIEELMK